MFRSVYYKVYKEYLKNAIKQNVKYKPLIAGLLKKTGGRNNIGKITSYHRGGGVSRLYKKVNNNYLSLWKLGFKKWLVERVEYDSNRSANIALLKSYFMYQLKTNWIKKKKKI